jgi:hypothetical protein
MRLAGWGKRSDSAEDGFNIELDLWEKPALMRRGQLYSEKCAYRARLGKRLAPMEHEPSICTKNHSFFAIFCIFCTKFFILYKKMSENSIFLAIFTQKISFFILF